MGEFEGYFYQPRDRETGTFFGAILFDQKAFSKDYTAEAAEAFSDYLNLWGNAHTDDEPKMKDLIDIIQKATGVHPQEILRDRRAAKPRNI